MSKHTKVVAAPLLALMAIASTETRAEWRCDCTQVTGSCKAGVVVKGSSVQITSDERACARVEYLIDGQPFVALVVDGEHREAWSPRDQAPDVRVQSCEICSDHLPSDADAAPASTAASAPARPAAGTSSPSTAPDTPLIKVAPAYPAGAAGRSGEVVVELDVGADGAVTQARVIEAQPRGVFEQAALDAARRWRYPSGAARTVKEKIGFQAPAARGADATAGAPAGPRNACVKEGNVDELVDIIQVQLIDACPEPVIVRTCAEGFAERADQWVCSPEPIALVARGDALNGLLGEMATDSGRVRFGYTEERYLSRPTATRYAWIACAIGDKACYGAAVRWTEYLNAKPSNVDPLAGSDIDVAVAR